MLYHRRSKYTPDGDKTKFATLEEENKALRLKTAEQAIEIDMLKSKRLLCEPYPVVKWAKYFEVSTSGYYTHGMKDYLNERPRKMTSTGW